METKKTIGFLSVVSLLTAVLIPMASAQNGNNGFGNRIHTCIQAYLASPFPHLPKALRQQRLIQLRLCIRQAVGNVGSSSSLSSSSSSRSSSSSSHSSSLSSSSSSMSSSSSSLPSSSSSSLSSSSSSMSSSLSSSSSSLSSSSVSSASVSITNFSFQPKNVTVKKGTIVKWTNMDSAPHTVTKTGAAGPTSGILFQNQSYSFQFNSTGSYLYHCQIHTNMTGSVLVTQ